MGKTVHFHPVSLTVIRAAAIYCGWRFGRINQVDVSESDRWAMYQCEITLIPEAAQPIGSKHFIDTLNACFSRDIKASSAWITKNGKTNCLLTTMLINDDQADDQADDQVDDPQPEAEQVEFPF